MSDVDLKLPPKPEPPGPTECCQSGCNPCVYDFYYEELREWEAEVARIKAAASKPESEEKA